MTNPAPKETDEQEKKRHADASKRFDDQKTEDKKAGEETPVEKLDDLKEKLGG
jgi:hypothetical protein